MGKLHPHGDSAIYEAMVRLAQPFAMRLPLVDGHGNFGSLDDGPAASRYTEARMARAALGMNANIGENTVDFTPNYDNKLQEPTVLPAAIRICWSMAVPVLPSAWPRIWRRIIWARWLPRPSI